MKKSKVVSQKSRRGVRGNHRSFSKKGSFEGQSTEQKHTRPTTRVNENIFLASILSQRKHARS
jgi:hypothetical protein